MRSESRQLRGGNRNPLKDPLLYAHFQLTGHGQLTVKARSTHNQGQYLWPY